jgi:hypothetical protein
MANQITKIIIRNGTNLDRRTANLTGITFNLGEPAFCTDTERLYIGNGTVGGVAAGVRNLGRVSTLYGSYLGSGFSQEAYNTFVSQGAEKGDIIFDQNTRTIYSLSARSNLTTNDVPLVADLVKYDISTLVNSTQFYYDPSLLLNLQVQGVAVTNLNSNVVDGVTLTKSDPSTPISLALGSVSNGVGVEHLRQIAQNSLFLNPTNNTNPPVLAYVEPGQIVGRTTSGTLTAININQILNNATYTPGPGLIITPTIASILFDFDSNFFACGNQFFINRNATVTGNLSCVNSTTTNNAAVSSNLTVGNRLAVGNTLAVGSSATIGGNATIGSTLTTGNNLTAGNDLTVVGNAYIRGSAYVNGALDVAGNTQVDGNLDVTGSITSPTFGALKNMATFASPRINAGTIPLFRSTYNIQIITSVIANATGGTPTFSPPITLNTTIPAGTLVSLIAGTSLTNVDVSFGYKYL